MGLRHYTRVIFVLWMVSLCCAGENEYGAKITNTVGELSPRGDILLEYGKDILNSTCNITNLSVPVTSKNRITFKLGKISIEDDLVERLNDRLARVVIKKPEMTKPITYLSCNLDDETIDMNYLVVGTKPHNIEDFKCLGYNFENMTCTWKRELTSNYDVDYSLRYRYRNVREPILSDFTCEKLENIMIDGVESMSCFWNMSTRPQLRVSHNNIYFTITGTNKKGSITNEFHREQKEIMKSDAPINLTVLRVKPRSMMLSWEIPFSITMMRGRKLQYRVMVTCEYWNMTSFKQVAVFWRNTTDLQIKYNLTDLPYAYTLYDIRVGVKLSKYNTEEMWSANSSVTNYTASLVPTSAPLASRTGFYFSEDDSVVTIYWKQLDKRYRNGPDFEYVVTPLQNGTSITLPVRTRNNAYVQYENISNSAHYKFKIESKNAIGKSKNASFIVIPPKRRITLRMAEPVQTEYSDVLYQLSWEPPIADPELLTNYTVYWCIAQKEAASHLCDGILEFKTVSKTTFKYNVTIPKNTNVQLAISANGEKQSSGMVWAGCRIHHTNVQHKIKKITVEHVTNTSLTLRWQVLCEHKTGNIKGYFVEYCRTNSTGLECVAEDMRNHTVYGANHPTVTINGLEPYSSYQLRVYTLDGTGSFSQSSEWVANTTFEGTPTAPYGLKITESSNKTISVEWFAPLKKNGIVSRYIIFYNDRQTEKPMTVNTPLVPEISFTLTNLTSYQEYNISVAACIREMCSNRSNFVVGRTRVGAPGQIREFSFNAEEKTISWPPPSHKGGNIDYYEVKLWRDNEEDHQAKIKIANGSSYVLVECIDGRINYKVRAVNLRGKTRFEGEWSREHSENCHTKIKAMSPVLVVALVIICSLGLIGSGFFGFRFLLKYFRRMKDIQFKLPPGMNNERPPSVDPQSLLDHKDHDLEPQNGSSGFNSAQESSSESGESISSRSTDSGSVQHRDDIDNSFQMRHLNDTYNSSSKSNGGGNYLSVFVVKQPETETRIGTLSSNDIPSKTNLVDEESPQIRKPVNSGYTPVQPTPSYVMAMPPGTESKGYVPSADLHKFMEPIILPPFRMSMPSTTFTNEKSSDKGYVHATYNGDLTSSLNSPKDSAPVFKVSPGYVSCADSTGHSVPAESTSSAYVMHKQLEQMVPNT